MSGSCVPLAVLIVLCGFAPGKSDGSIHSGTRSLERQEEICNDLSRQSADLAVAHRDAGCDSRTSAPASLTVGMAQLLAPRGPRASTSPDVGETEGHHNVTAKCSTADAAQALRIAIRANKQVIASLPGNNSWKQLEATPDIPEATSKHGGDSTPQFVEAALGSSPSEDKAVALVVAVSKQLTSILGIGSSARLLDSAKAELSPQSNTTEVSEQPEQKALATADPKANGEKAGKEDDEKETPEHKSLAKSGQEGAEGDSRESAVAAIEFLLKRQGRKVDSESILAGLAKDIPSAVAQYASPDPWVEWNKIKGQANPCPPGDKAECRVMHAECRCTPKVQKPHEGVVKVPPSWGFPMLQNNVWTCDVYRKDTCGKNQPNCDNKCPGVYCRAERERRLMKCDKQIPPSCGYEKIPLETRTVWARSYDEQKDYKLHQMWGTKDGSQTMPNVDTGMFENPSVWGKKIDDGFLPYWGYQEGKWWQRCPQQAKPVNVERMRKAKASVNPLVPSSMKEWWETNSRLAPSLYKMQIKPGGGLATSCWAGINMNFHNGVCDRPGVKKNPQCGWAAAKCQELPVQMVILVDASSGAVKAGEVPQARIADSNRLLQKIKDQGNALCDDAVALQYSFYMWKHTTCNYVYQKGMSKPTLKCVSKKTCVCGDPHIAGNYKGVMKLRNQLFGDGMWGKDQTGVTALGEATNATVADTLAVAFGRRRKKSGGGISTLFSAKKDKKTEGCDLPKDAQEKINLKASVVQQQALCAALPPPVELLSRQGCTQW